MPNVRHPTDAISLAVFALKVPDGSAVDVPHYAISGKQIRPLCLETVSHLFVYIVYMSKPYTSQLISDFS